MANFKNNVGAFPTFEGEAAAYRNRNEDSLQNGVCRAAFPAFRVFIYGKEVTSDVTDVRVDQSGGSMDRSTSTFSVSLINKNDKYIITHSDMLNISAGRRRVNNGIKENLASFRSMLQDRVDAMDDDDSTVDAIMQMLANGSEVGEFDRDESVQAMYKSLYSSGSDTPFLSFDFSKIKREVINDKARQVINGSAQILEKLRLNDPAKLYQFTKEELAILFKYPLSEGDSIFHPNDPVRIAFRDPFKPWRWYWSFTGFVDGYSEETGVNQESIVTVNGTDVLKTARYSYFQMDVNAVRDKAIQALFRENPNLLEAEREGSVAAFQMAFFENIFQGFSVNEIMEILFFGYKSFQGSVDQFTKDILNTMTDDEQVQYILNYGKSGATPDKVRNMSAEERKSVIHAHAEDRRSTYDRSIIPPLMSPGGVMFKRNNESYGVVSYFVGDATPSALERALGANLGLNELKYLNDELHHRVDVTDLDTMALEGVTTKMAAQKSIVDSDIYSVISEIGTNIEKYPVGHGRVFAVIPAELSLGLTSKALDQNFRSQTSDMHSQFKDRLTYLYDVADSMQFCFYATPRGDVVFEMPFYDFEPWNFSTPGSSNFLWNSDAKLKRDATLAQMASNVERWASGSENYDPKEVYEMMGLYKELEISQEGFIPITDSEDACDYVRDFTFTKADTIDYSMSLSDSGLKTIARGSPRPLPMYTNLDNANLYDYVFATIPGLSATLGFRMAADRTAWNAVQSAEAAQLSAAVELRKANADARNLGVQVLPRFSLMVNRPMYWRPRNYLANIVSCQHSISVNSSCQTTINLSQVKAWSGSYRDDNSSEEYWDFFGGTQPFDMFKLLSKDKKSEDLNTTEGETEDVSVPKMDSVLSDRISEHFQNQNELKKQETAQKLAQMQETQRRREEWADLLGQEPSQKDLDARQARLDALKPSQASNLNSFQLGSQSLDEFATEGPQGNYWDSPDD